MKITNEKLFMALLRAYMGMTRGDRMRKLKYDGSLKLEVGTVRPFTKVVAEFASAEEEKEFIQAVIDAPNLKTMKRKADELGE